MVKIRLRRLGAKKAPFYRVVVADKRRGANFRLRRGAPHSSLSHLKNERAAPPRSMCR